VVREIWGVLISTLTQGVGEVGTYDIALSHISASNAPRQPKQPDQSKHATSTVYSSERIDLGTVPTDPKRPAPRHRRKAAEEEINHMIIPDNHRGREISHRRTGQSIYRSLSGDCKYNRYRQVDQEYHRE
jgi:hypothetical protein